MSKSSKSKSSSSSSNNNYNSSSSSSYYAVIGDVAHVVTLVSTLGFAYAVATRFDDDTSPFFDQSWRRDGFCVTNIDIPYKNSHDACLYFDTIAGIVLFAIYYALKDSKPGMTLANEQMIMGIPGIVGHGIGHGAIAADMRRSRSTLSEDNNLSDSLLGGDDPMLTQYDMLMADRGAISFGNAISSDFMLKGLLPLTFFWMSLLKASCPNLRNTTIAIMSSIAMFVQLFVPRLFGFTYVQTVLLVAFSINQMMRSSQEKADIHYPLYPWLVSFPLTVIGWMESTMCESWVRDTFYGHLIYDGFIPIAMLVWYLLCYYYNTTASPSSTAEEKKTKTA